MIGRALAGLVVAAPVAAFGQGVPVVDGARIGAVVEKVGAQKADGVRQDTKIATAEEQQAREAEKVAEMEAIIAEITGPSASVEAVKEDAGEAEQSRAELVLFGKPKASLEALIVEVALEYANRNGVPKVGLSAFEWRCLFQALIKQESAFNPAAQSPVGAYGLTQLMPGTASDMGVDRHDVRQNLQGGAKYLSIQLGSFGRIDHALAAYNAGPGNVRKYGGIPPFKETQNYVQRVTRFAAEYGARIDGLEGLGSVDPATFGSGEVARTAEAVKAYSQETLEKIEAAQGRLERYAAQLDETTGLKDAADLNTLVRRELGHLLSLLSELKAARAELAAYEAGFRASGAARNAFFWDWRLPERFR